MSTDISALDGRVALVTGAAQGLGEAAALALAERGASVVLTDINPVAGEALASMLRKRGTDAEFLQHDVSCEEQWVSVVNRAIARFGNVDILVNNAGIIEFAPIDEMPVDLFDRVMRINVRSVFLGCKHILPAMELAGGGSIINMSSVAGMVANSPGSAAYATSKGAVRLLTKAVAVDYAGYNIRVNSIHPGGIATPAALPYMATQALTALAIGHSLIRRFGEPREVGDLVAFLASDAASYITGAEIPVDGGWTAV